MLQGTFETLSLPEVLGLLAGARKSGALWLEAGPVSGVVHLTDGHCHATESSEHRGPVVDGTELLGRLVDVCFATMCQDAGSFRFADDDPPPWTCSDPVELSDALVEVDRLLKQWREILRVIPSLECRPQLLDALEVDQLVFDREGWALLVAIDGRRTVRELTQRTGRPVMDVCQALLELVEAGAVGVIDPAAGRTAEPEAAHEPVPDPDPDPDPAPPAPEPEPDLRPEPGPEPGLDVAPVAEAAPAPVLTIVPEAAVEPPVYPEPESSGAPAPAPVAEAAPVAAEAASGGEAPDKGAFLRLFSGLRES